MMPLAFEGKSTPTQVSVNRLTYFRVFFCPILFKPFYNCYVIYNKTLLTLNKKIVFFKNTSVILKVPLL